MASVQTVQARAMPPPRRRRRTWIPILLATLAFVAWFLQSSVLTRVVARAVEAAAGTALGEDVTIGRLEVTYLPPQAAAHGIVVSHRATQEPVIAAKELRLVPGWSGWRPVLRRLVIVAPEVDLHLDADGLREFREAPPVTGRTMDAFPWEELTIEGGRFHFASADGFELDVRGIGATPGVSAGTNDITLDEVMVRVGPYEQRARGVTLPQVGLTPARVVVPWLDLDFDGASLDGSFAADRAGPLRGDLSAHVPLARLTRTPARASYVDGLLDADVEVRGTVDAPEVSGSVSWLDVVVWDPPHRTVLGDADAVWALRRIDDAAASGVAAAAGADEPAATRGPSRTGLRLDVDRLRWRWAEGLIEATASLDLDAGVVRADVLAQDVRLPRILQNVGTAPTPWVDLVGDVEAHVSGTVSPIDVRGPFEVAVGDLRVNDGPIDRPGTSTMLHVDAGTVVGNLHFDAERLELDARRLVALSRGGHRSEGRAVARIPFAVDGTLDIDVDMSRLDLAQLAPLGGAGLGGVATVEGWIGGRVNAPLSCYGDVSGVDVVALDLPVADTLRAKLASPDMLRLQFEDIVARRGDTPYTGRLELGFFKEMFVDAAIDVADGRVRDLLGVVLELPGLDAKVRASARLTGPVYHMDGDVRAELRDIDMFGEPFDGGYANGWFDDGIFTLDALRLTRAAPPVDGAARPAALFAARGSVGRKWALNLEALVDGARVENLAHVQALRLPLQGALTADWQFGGTLFEPVPRGRVAVRDAAWGHERLPELRVDATTSAGVLRWAGGLRDGSLETHGSLDLWRDRSWEVAGALAAFPLHLFWPEGADGQPVEARATGEAILGGALGGPQGGPRAATADIRVADARVSWSGHNLLAPEPWTLKLRGSDLHIPTARLMGDDGTVLSFGGSADGRGGMRFEGGGSFNLDWLRAFTPGLTEARGEGSVEVVVARGATGAVEPRIVAWTRSATVTSDYFPAPLEGLRLRVEGDATGYDVLGVEARVGGGTFTGPRSRIDADGWIPSRYALAGAFRDVSVKYFDYLPIIHGDADLRFDGPANDLLLSGTIDLERVEFRERIDWESTVLSLRAERLTGRASEDADRLFAMDLAVNGPDGSVLVRNNVATADASARLRIIGDTERPGMVGTVRIVPGGRMFLHEREFEIARGELRWVDPYTFDPDLDILLETDVRSQETDYHVRYGVTGPFSDWTTNTTADPWLAQADINALLLFGVTREELERYGGLSTALVAETSDLLLAQTALTRIDLWVDRWSLVSGVSERGSSVVSSDLRLVAEKQWEGFSFTVEKNLSSGLGSDWYASVERRIAQRLYATAYVATRQEGRALPIGGAYGAEFTVKLEAD